MNAVIKEVIKMENNMLQKATEKLGLKVNVKAPKKEKKNSIDTEVFTPNVDNEMEKIKEVRKRNNNIEVK